MMPLSNGEFPINIEFVCCIVSSLLIGVARNMKTSGIFSKSFKHFRRRKRSNPKVRCFVAFILPQTSAVCSFAAAIPDVSNPSKKNLFDLPTTYDKRYRMNIAFSSKELRNRIEQHKLKMAHGIL
jgi:hypothetical protein